MTWYSPALETLYSLAGKMTPYTAWSILEKIKKGATMSPDELAQIQWQRLSSCINFAYENVKLYRDLWSRSGIHPKDIKDRNDFSKLPVLTRAEIAARPPEDLMSRSADARGLVSVCSSGTTTGKPLRVFLDNACYNHQYANLLYGYYLMGWRLGTPMMTVRNFAHGDYRGAYCDGDFSHEPFEAVRSLVYRFVHRKQLLPPLQGSMRPDIAHMASIHSRIKAYAPYLLEGNAYFWYQFARYLLERGERLPSVRAVEIDEVTLSSGQKELISQCFNCPVYDCYGSHELGVVAHGCSAGRGNHILSLSHYVEIIDTKSGRKAPPDAIGSVIITDISNSVMPLIRYETGDLASMPAGSCPCGNSYPRMSSIAGRAINCVPAAGKTCTEQFFLEHIFRFEEVVAFQIDKSRPEAITVQLISRTPGVREMIETGLKQSLGMPVTVLLVDAIALDRPGKARWVRA
ncbi:MAG: phenylacetate--CoA ligase family protein [Deltaproteobacteria bacterium]|nr:phenylacetate--CoA ligase family protein [Deltaproteobacteria bacterium]